MTRKWSARSLRNLKGVHPHLRRLFERALQETPNDFAVTCGLRTLDEQREMVASGASQTMNSAHLTGYAVDVAYFDKRGNVVWDWPIYEKNAEVIKRIADQMGISIQWGGDWKSLRDGPHFELHRDRYDWKEPIEDVAPVKRTQVAAKAASEHKTDVAAAVGTVGGALGSVVASAQDAPPVLQYAIAAVIVLGAAAFIWERVRQ